MAKGKAGRQGLDSVHPPRSQEALPGRDYSFSTTRVPGERSSSGTSSTDSLRLVAELRPEVRG